MKKILLLVVCVLFVFAIRAQEQTNTNDFKPYWTIGANGGINWFFGENNFPLNSTAAFSVTNNIGYLGRLDLTRQISPVVGIRGMLGFNKYNYFNTFNKTYNSEVLTGDVVFNLTNLKKGYDPDRFFDFLVFGGLGAGYVNNNTAVSPIEGMLRAGLQGDFKLSPSFKLNLIAELNVLTDNANNSAFLTGTPFDLGPALTVGFAYRIPEKKAAPVVPETTEVPEVKPETPVVEPEVVPEVKPEVPVIEPVEVAKEEPVKEVEPVKEIADKVNEHIFFTINQREIQSTEQKDAMQRIADFIAAHPESKVIISGYADRGTGTDAVNNEISKQRAVLVANTLIRQYGVPYKNIWVRWFGSGVQPYEKAAQNRLVIVRGAASFKEALTIPNIVKKTVEASSETSGAVKVQESVSTAKAAVKAEESAIIEVVHFTEKITALTTANQQAVIKKVVDYLKRNPNSMVSISGYADSVQDDEKVSTQISKDRAEAVSNSLKTAGIDSERVQVRWYGAQKENGITPTMNKMVLINTTK